MRSESSAQYIHMVQHLIEECILFNMSKEECMEALNKHANINPVITSTVWKELEKENTEFFEAYTKRRGERGTSSDSSCSSSSSSEMSQRINNIFLDSSKKLDDN